MADKSKIEWTDSTWNPVVGCTRISPGCVNCYAKTLHDMRHKAWLDGWTDAPEQYHFPFEQVRFIPERLDKPLRWKTPRRVFVNSMSDLFHESISFETIDKIFAVMFSANGHQFQVLTKRPKRMREYMRWRTGSRHIAEECFRQYVERMGEKYDGVLVLNDFIGELRRDWPPSNIWLGTSVENQKTADYRIGYLLDTPAAIRFLSCEPLLGSIDLHSICADRCPQCHGAKQVRDSDNGGHMVDCPCERLAGLGWVIVGGESGAGARPMHPNWARSIRDQCTSAGVPFFFKQWGDWKAVTRDTKFRVAHQSNPEWHLWPDEGEESTVSKRVGKKAAGRLIDRRTWDEMPKVEVHA